MMSGKVNISLAALRHTHLKGHHARALSWSSQIFLCCTKRHHIHSAKSKKRQFLVQCKRGNKRQTTIQSKKGKRHLAIQSECRLRDGTTLTPDHQSSALDLPDVENHDFERLSECFSPNRFRASPSSVLSSVALADLPDGHFENSSRSRSAPDTAVPNEALKDCASPAGLASEAEDGTTLQRPKPLILQRKSGKHRIGDQLSLLWNKRPLKFNIQFWQRVRKVFSSSHRKRGRLRPPRWLYPFKNNRVLQCSPSSNAELHGPCKDVNGDSLQEWQGWGPGRKEKLRVRACEANSTAGKDLSPDKTVAPPAPPSVKPLHNPLHNHHHCKATGTSSIRVTETKGMDLPPNYRVTMTEGGHVGIITLVHDYLKCFYMKYGSFIPLSKSRVLMHLQEKLHTDLTLRMSFIYSEVDKYVARLSVAPLHFFKVVFNKHTLTLEDLFTLENQNWLNDQVINTYGELIMESSHQKVHFFNSFFHRQLVTKGYEGVKRWTKKVDLFSKRLLLVPIHLEIHWSLVTVDIANRKVHLYDSQGIVSKYITESILRYVNTEARERKQNVFETGWKVATKERIPQQRNENDCGVFVLEYCRCLALGQPLRFSQKDIPKVRKRIYMELCERNLRH